MNGEEERERGEENTELRSRRRRRHQRLGKRGCQYKSGCPEPLSVAEYSVTALCKVCGAGALSVHFNSRGAQCFLVPPPPPPPVAKPVAQTGRKQEREREIQNEIPLHRVHLSPVIEINKSERAVWWHRQVRQQQHQQQHQQPTASRQ